MQLQFDVRAQDIGFTDPMTSDQIDQLVGLFRERLDRAGFEVWVGSDEAVVSPGEDEYDTLTPEEEAAGGYTYPELRVEGPARIDLCVFKRSVLFVSQGDYDDEQASAAEVLTVIRALDGVLPVPGATLEHARGVADRHAVNADGTIRRRVISHAQQSERAIELFDRVRSPELRRPTADAFARDHFERLRGMTIQAAPFRAALAIDPVGGSTKMAVPRGLHEAESDSHEVEEAMLGVLRQALQQKWSTTGMPTGLVVQWDGKRLDPSLVFDNPVDGGALDPEARAERARFAPHAWQTIAHAAAARDPRFQPTWLPEAIEILTAAGRDVTINRERTADPSELHTPSLRDRLRQRFRS